MPYLFEIATKNLLFNATTINFVWICQHSSGAIWCKLSDSLYRISSGLRFSKGYHHSCKRGSLMRISWGKLSNRFFFLFQFVYLLKCWGLHNCTVYKDWSEKKLTIFTPMFYMIKSLIFNQSFWGVLLIYIFVENHQ